MNEVTSGARYPPESEQVKIEKISDMIGESRRLIVLVHELKDTSARLRAVSASLVTSDKNLLEANEQLVRLVEELALTNENLTKANEQISNSEKMQKEFIDIAAHELRTPVQPILGVLDLYEINPPTTKVEGKADGGNISVEKEHLRLIGRNAERLARLSSDILDATKIESHNLKLNIDKNVDLTELVSYSVEDIEKKVADANIELLANFPEVGVQADVDSYRILQVLTNLLDNAVKFTPKGTISITVKKENNGKNQVVVIISDSGRGIDPEIMPRLFQKFSSKTDKGSGTGLGLYLCKSIVESHGGRIWAENNKEGVGATFAFALPLAKS